MPTDDDVFQAGPRHLPCVGPHRRLLPRRRQDVQSPPPRARRPLASVQGVAVRVHGREHGELDHHRGHAGAHVRVHAPLHVPRRAARVGPPGGPEDGGGGAPACGGRPVRGGHAEADVRGDPVRRRLHVHGAVHLDVRRGARVPQAQHQVPRVP
ncbi:hypothetical protein PR202_ga16094 [Eleusine coracana subsp. coracana]|uniref:Uncharacterized protein n=1 Tax=Eleusine coracana subsp. coracana TaxID=191504 RepID=A0AAV5CMB5_ELECO|nr:hypothetical protein PR202_ga16094 [Eleusine coracana subsp. coracana]